MKERASAEVPGSENKSSMSHSQTPRDQSEHLEPAWKSNRDTTGLIDAGKEEEEEEATRGEKNGLWS